MLTIFYDKTFTFHNKTPLPSPAENRYSQLAANPRRTRTQDCCEKVKRFVENPPPPSSPRLLHPGVDHLHPPDPHSRIKAGETSILSNELLVVEYGDALCSKDYGLSMVWRLLGPKLEQQPAALADFML